MRIAIIGCGAAGAFCGAVLREMLPSADITLFEAHTKPLAKVAVTGGGRCNLTNSFAGIRSLAEAYPRGEKLMKRALKVFSQEDTCRWFERHGVQLVLQEDHCWFPASQDAMEIVRTLLRALDGAVIRTGCRVRKILPPGDVVLENGARESFDAVVVTTGGAPLHPTLLEGLDLPWEAPVPSLFTFLIEGPLRSLAGTVAQASVSLQGTPYRAEGPLLVTDWGVSGPAVLKLSSYAARFLAESGYRADLVVNWLQANEQQVRALLAERIAAQPRKLLSSVHPDGLTARLWTFLRERSGVPAQLRCESVGKNVLNRLTDRLIHDVYPIAGKSPFKEEFVTCGGVSLSAVHPATLACKKYPGLYFAGEILDIDAITGGFNLQAAWTTAYLVASAITNP